MCNQPWTGRKKGLENVICVTYGVHGMMWKQHHHPQQPRSVPDLHRPKPSGKGYQHKVTGRNKNTLFARVSHGSNNTAETKRGGSRKNYTAPCYKAPPAMAPRSTRKTTAENYCILGCFCCLCTHSVPRPPSRTSICVSFQLVRGN